ncbi:arylsulfatase [Sinomicrobium weinanense]|uniref:Arylsulfatase n=1 Tax=Sinomicrobium weinanense TaxID=2842200 RepID=A0A926JT92_9FLAO|nr:arylsulfatase [Sinomicrobium weinanense]MBC9797083.1 arylsulfatase [Sinomicrobium weinanense]MBU3122688.1 arylsulfatase [Sinomicrobium weinanense]
MKYKANILFSVGSALFILLSCNTKPKTQKEERSAEPSRPNIIFILADDMGIGDLGCYGQEYIKTPHIDRMASEGMRFTQFYAGSTVCAPSRASLMTGQHTGVTHVRGNGEFPLLETDTTVAQLLRQQGYSTAMYGKWGLGLEGTAGEPQKKGWEHFTGHLHHVDAHYQRPDSLWRLKDGKLQKFATPENSYSNEIFAQDALQFIKQQPEDKPFFLYLSFTIPHAELVVANEYMQPYLDDKGESVFTPETAHPDGKHYGPQPYPKAAYAAMVSSIDHYTGQVLQQLREKGIDKNTLVIFSSDNGTHVEGGRSMDDVAFFNSSSNYKGVKRDMYEGGIHEPFIVRWPGQVKPGQESDHIAAFWDVLPTLAELGGVEKTPENINGISFVPELLDQGKQPQHEYLYWEFYEQGGKQAVRKQNWKAVRLNIKKDPDAPIELYDLSADPAETQNIADKHPDIVAEMENIMQEAHTPSPLFSF